EMAVRTHFGPGRMSEPPEIVLAIALAMVPRDFAGVPVLVTAGPTREALDPVRFLSNRSSGRMGFALAEAARDRGADVTLVAGPTSIEPPHGIRLVPVTTAAEMEMAMRAQAVSADLVVMAAAVADFRPKRAAAQKIKRVAIRRCQRLPSAKSPTRCSTGRSRSATPDSFPPSASARAAPPEARARRAGPVASPRAVRGRVAHERAGSPHGSGESRPQRE